MNNPIREFHQLSTENKVCLLVAVICLGLLILTKYDIWIFAFGASAGRVFWSWLDEKIQIPEFIQPKDTTLH